MVISLFVMGVPSIRDFALPIAIGLVFGTYSSVFLSGSFWYMLSGGDVEVAASQPITAKKKLSSGGNGSLAASES
jgi:SecD/SecF fusion protein